MILDTEQDILNKSERLSSFRRAIENQINYIFNSNKVPYDVTIHYYLREGEHYTRWNLRIVLPAATISTIYTSVEQVKSAYLEKTWSCFLEIIHDRNLEGRLDLVRVPYSPRMRFAPKES